METIRALVVDDEEPLRDILRVSLEYFGVEVVGEAGNGVEAVSLFRDLRPNVVILDLNMPRMGGLETLDELRKLDPEVVVIIITASVDEAMRLEGIRRGCRGFLRKPFKIDELHQDMLTNLRIYLAERRGEPLAEDYYRYVVKPEFRPDRWRNGTAGAEGTHDQSWPESPDPPAESDGDGDGDGDPAPDAPAGDSGEVTGVQFVEDSAAGPAGVDPPPDVIRILSDENRMLRHALGRVHEMLGVLLRSLPPER